MTICPECKTEQARRKSGCCPSCGTAVNVWNPRDGSPIWYRVGSETPPAELVRIFEGFISRRLSAQRDRAIDFNFPRKSSSYKVQVATAEQLLAEADNDIEIAEEALNILFTDKQYNFKSYTSFLLVRKDWPVVVAIARSNVEYRRSLQDGEELFEKRLEARGNVFGDRS